MSTTYPNLKQWLKTSPNPLARSAMRVLRGLLALEVPAPSLLFSPAYYLYRSSSTLWQSSLRVLWWTPLFKSRCRRCDDGLYLYGGLPYFAGPVDLSVGKNCRISGRTTITGRSAAPVKPRLRIGDNVDLGWQSTLAIGTRIELGDNVRIAGQCFLAGYPGHPLDAQRRAAGCADDDGQARDIVLEQDVWLGTGVTVLAGVRIGRGTVVSAGSLVCRDLPAGVIAGGNPARVIRSLDAESTV